MKVQDIRSFFQKPSSSRGGGGSSRNTAEDTSEQVVEVPSRLKKGGSKKKSKDDHLNVSIERSEDSDLEDPLPKNARKGKELKDEDCSKPSRKKKPPVIEDDSDDEDPIPKASREKFKKIEKEKSLQDKKRKARVLSDSEDDDGDFKSTARGRSKPVEKPAVKLAKVDKSLVAEKKKEEMKPIDPLDFFGSGPVKRETRKVPETKKPSPVKEPHISPAKQGLKSPSKSTKSPDPVAKASPSRASPRRKSNGHSIKEDSPHRPLTAIIEPKKLKMPTPTPEKQTEMSPKASSSRSSSVKKTETSTSKKTPEKQDKQFKVPTPIANEKSKSRTASAKRSIPEDDEDEEDFNPNKKAAKSSKKDVTPSRKRDETPAKDTDDEDKESKQQSTPKQNYMKYLAKMSMKPKNLGSKDIPIGAPECFKGQTFVISGVLDSLERDDCRDLVVKYGGRVTAAVSGKTSFLIIGDDPGESKVKKAVQLKVPQITEDELLEMLRKSNPGANSQDSGWAASEDMYTDSERIKSDYDADTSLFSSPASKKDVSPAKKLEPSKLAKRESPRKSEQSPSPKVTKKEVEIKREKSESPQKVKASESKVIKTEVKEIKPVASSSSAPPPSTSAAVSGEAGLMWVDKYKPKNLKNVVGQVSETSNAKKLSRWLTNWFKYHGSSQDKPKPAWPGLKDPEGKTFKAALLSGPPGVGKTTTAHLAVREIGYDYFELNASDTRNKRGLQENVADALSCKSLVFGKGDQVTARQHVLIMDEVDGMSGNEDRGGVQELIALIKSSRVPIICICNDRNHQKIRSLANYCFDLRFNKPSFEQLKAFVMSICFKEKITIPKEKMQQLIVSTDNDVRQILHQLELFKDGQSHQASNPKKDLRFGPWDVIRKVFLKSEHHNMSIHDKSGLFFQDYSIGPLFVQENYIKWTPAKAGGNRHKHLDLISKTASSIADGEMVEATIRKSQNWSLLPVQAMFSSYMPGEYMEANSMGNVDFPQWLGKNSNRNKRHRLLQSLHTHLHLHVSGSLQALNMDYMPYLQRTITSPLVRSDHESAAKVMEDYTLLRDDVEGINELALWPGMRDPMDRVDSKVKAAFTRQVNKEMLPYSNAKIVKGRAKANQEEDLEALLEEGEGGVAGDEEEDESIEKDAMVKVKTRKAGSSKAAASKSKKGKKGKDSDDDEDVPKAKGKASKAKPRKGK